MKCGEKGIVNRGCEHRQAIEKWRRRLSDGKHYVTVTSLLPAVTSVL